MGLLISIRIVNRASKLLAPWLPFSFEKITVFPVSERLIVRQPNAGTITAKGKKAILTALYYTG